MSSSVQKFAGSSRRVLVSFALWPLSAACSAGLEADSGASFEDAPVASSNAAIINGSSSANPRVVKVKRGNAVCSGTLLRSDIVLTARHCVGTLDGELPRHRIETPDGAVYEISSREQIRESRDADIALLRLDQKVPIDGRTDYWTSIYDGSLSALDGKQVVCIGYGVNTCDGAGLGTQRRATLTVDDADTNILKFKPNASGQIMSGGDSGGPCFLNGEVVGTQRSVNCGVSASQVPTTTHQQWIRQNIVELRNDYFFDFVSDRELSYFDIIDLPGSRQGPSSWEIPQGQHHPQFGSLVQRSNIYAPGSIALMKEVVLGDGALTARVRAESDDSASIVFRYQDSRNFYRLTAWDEGSSHQSGVYKVKNGTVTLLGSIPNSDLSENELYVSVGGSGFYASTFGGVARVTDSDFPDGKVGLMTDGLEDGRFDEFEVIQ